MVQFIIDEVPCTHLKMKIKKISRLSVGLEKRLNCEIYSSLNLLFKVR